MIDFIWGAVATALLVLFVFGISDKAARRAWYASDEGKMCRPVAQANMDQLKSLASEADAGGDDEDGPPM